MKKDDRTWSILCHLSGFTGFVFPFGNILAPLLIWLIKKPDSKFLDQTGKEVVNFQISMAIYFVVCMILMFTIIGIIVAIPAFIIIFIMAIISMIKGAMAADKGQVYHYPLTLHLIN